MNTIYFCRFAPELCKPDLSSRETDHLIIPKDTKVDHEINYFILIRSGEHEEADTLDMCIPENGHDVHENTRPKLLSEVCRGS